MRRETFRWLAALLVATCTVASGGSSGPSSVIEFSRLIETFTVVPGTKPEWSMGAGSDTPELRWLSSGVEGKPNCGAYESCRKGETRVSIDGKEMQQLRQRLEPVPWGLLLYSRNLGKFGPEAISIYPSCDAVHCTFDLTGALTRIGFKLTKLCSAMKDGAAKTAFWIQKGAKSSYLVIDENAGSGGESISFDLLFTKPADPKSLCVLDW